MSNNEFYLNPSGWNGELYIKVKFPLNLDKAAEFLTTDGSWRNKHPEILFCAEPSNITDLKRFLKTSTAVRSIRMNGYFDKSLLTERKCAEWFSGHEKLTRYLRIDVDALFPYWNDRQNMFNEIKKTKDCSRLINIIKQKGIDIHRLSMTGPRAKGIEKKFLKFSVDEDLEKLVKLSSNNNDVSRLVTKFILGGSYAFRFIDYDE